MKKSSLYLILTGLICIVTTGLMRDQIASKVRQVTWLLVAQEGGLRDESEAEAWNARANDYIEGKDAQSALFCFQAAVEFDGQQAKYYRDLANAMIVFRTDAKKVFKIDDRKLCDRVSELFENALRLSPDNFELACDYADTFYLMKPARVAGARHAWEIARSIAGNDYDRETVEMHLARLDIDEHKYDSAGERLLLVMHDDNQGMREVIFRRLVRERVEFNKRAQLSKNI